jgi:hypothetical protein
MERDQICTSLHFTTIGGPVLRGMQLVRTAFVKVKSIPDWRLSLRSKPSHSFRRKIFLFGLNHLCPISRAERRLANLASCARGTRTHMHPPVVIIY